MNVVSGRLRKGLFGGLGSSARPRLTWSIIGDKIASCFTRKKYDVTEVGIMHPEQIETDLLNAGQVGYIACNMKDSTEGK